MKDKKINILDYVIASKWSDGDIKDEWAIGFYIGETNHTPPRFLIIDDDNQIVRHNGFRRIQKLTKKRGQWILNHKELIEMSNKSIWYYLKCSMKKEFTLLDIIKQRKQ